MEKLLQTKIVYMGTKGPFSDLITFGLQTNFTFDVQRFDSVNDFADYKMKGGQYFLVICDGSMSMGQIVRAYEINVDTGKGQVVFPFFIIATKEFQREFSELKNVVFLERANALDQIQSKVQNFFVENKHVKPSTHCPVNFEVLTAFDGLEVSVFIRLPTGRFLKIFSEDDNILEEDVEKYAKKGVHLLYLKKKAAQWILKEVNKNFSGNMNSLERGEKIKIKSPPRDDEKDDLKMSVLKEFEESQSESKKEKKEKSLQEVIMELQAEKEMKKNELAKEIEVKENIAPQEDSVGNEKKIQKVIEKFDGSFVLGAEFATQVNDRVEKAVKVMMKNPSLKKLLDKMKLDRDPTRYFNNHVNLLCRITCVLAQLLEWNHETTLEKLIFVSYMHDITLVDFPHLAKIQNLVDYQAVESELSAKEKKLYINHPKDVSQLITELEDAPVDADKIVLQHHELPNGLGFPHQLNHQRILPLSALFIVAHDLVNFILENDTWTFSTYSERASKIFIGPNFTKIIRKMASVKD